MGSENAVHSSHGMKKNRARCRNDRTNDLLGLLVIVLV